MSIPTRIYDLSATASSNSPSGSDTVGTTWDDYLRAIQSVLRGDLATKGADIASASTTDLGAVQGYFHDITGTTTITSFGTVAAGVSKCIKFEGALTITHNATSLILPGAANITTADGDVAIVGSEGSGNWRCVAYTRASGLAISGAPFIDSTALLRGSSDATKLVRFEVDGLTTATTRVITVADINFTIGKYPTRQVFLSGTGTYTTPSGATCINVRLVGGGGSGATSGANGGDTTFSTLTGQGGRGAGAQGAAGGVGGTGTNGDINISGGAGAPAHQGAVANVLFGGGNGGSSVFGGGGGGGSPGGTGTAGGTNSGGGGGADGTGSATNGRPGGGAGGYCEKLITAPSATYSYGVGAGGAAGTGGAAGAAGIIIVDEYYD
jgi:hypothetical protein